MKMSCKALIPFIGVRVKGQKAGRAEIKNSPYPESGYGEFFIAFSRSSGS